MVCGQSRLTKSPGLCQLLHCNHCGTCVDGIKGSISRQPSQLPILLQGTAATSFSAPSSARLRTISL